MSSLASRAAEGGREVFIRSQVPAQLRGPREGEWPLVFAKPMEPHKAGLLSHYQPQLTGVHGAHLLSGPRMCRLEALGVNWLFKSHT